MENYKYNIFDFGIAVASFKSIVAICVYYLHMPEALPVLPRGLFLVFMVLPSRIHCKTQVKTLLVVALSLGKQLEPFGNSLHTPFYMKYQLKTENVQFWLTPREESEGTL